MMTTGYPVAELRCWREAWPGHELHCEDMPLEATAVPLKGLTRDLILLFFVLGGETFLGDFDPGELDSRSIEQT